MHKGWAMRLLTRTYDGLIYGMAILAAALLVAVMLTICLDVFIRNLDRQPSAHFFTLSEYALLLIPCLGAPWLVREKGHIYIEILLMQLPASGRKQFIRLIGVACVLVCALLAWYGADVAFKDWTQGNKDVRSFDAPRWVIVMWIPISFAFMATECLRHLFRGDSFLAPMADETSEGQG
jgi:TRAP-type C4-dicarboxylate transport system permease small subunit